MRITALDRSFPLSYDITANDSSIATFVNHTTNGLNILNTSASINVFTNPLVDIGGHPFANSLSDSYLKINGNSNIQTLSSSSSVSFGYFMEPPVDNKKYAYNVSGIIRDGHFGPLDTEVFPSLVIAHLDTGHSSNHNNVNAYNEYYVCTVISEIPLNNSPRTNISSSDGVQSQAFNIAFHDNGTPPNETSRIFFALCFRSSDESVATLTPTVFTIDIWRQLSPINVSNHWQS